MADQKLEELTVKELRAKAVEMGLPEADVKLFKTKAVLIATINTIKSKEVVDLNPPESPAQVKKDQEHYLTKAEKMRDLLDKQPKVRVKIPLDIGGKEKPGVLQEFKDKKGRKQWRHVSGAVETVTLNGCKTLIPKGRYWEVPQQVADVLADAEEQTNRAGEAFSVDRIDPKTGRPVRDQL